MAWLGRGGRPPRKSVGGHENSLRDAMRSRGGITIRPSAAPTDIEDNESEVPEKSTLDWLNLNALAPKAIQGAIDRIRLSTMANTGEAEAQKEAEGELLTSPRRAGGGQPTGSKDGYPRPARKSLSSALRARGGITRPSSGTEPFADMDETPPSVPEEGEEAVQDAGAEEDAAEAAEAGPAPAPAQPSADRTASAPLPVLHEEEDEPRTIPVVPEDAEPVEEAAEPAPETPQETEQAEEVMVDRQDEPELDAPSEQADQVEEDPVSLQDLPPRQVSEDSKDGNEPRSKAKNHQEPSARLPMPTPLMAATASARRAEPPSVVEAPKLSEATQEPAGKPLLAPEPPTLRIQTKDVGKLKELREFWGNKSSKGFAGPGLAGSRLSKNEAQATLQRLLIAGGDFDEVRRLRKIIADLDA